MAAVRQNQEECNMLLDSKCKKCRRAGQKLFLRGDRCFGQKCAMIRRPYLPGNQGKNKARRKVSEYGMQLSEKQKVRWNYGVSERQLKRYFREIAHHKGNKKELLIVKLESRLDNAVFRLGWAKSRRLARQMVSHGHILVNGKKVNIPSYQVKKSDVIRIKETSQGINLFKDLKTVLKKQETPQWLSFDSRKLEAKVLGKPNLDDAGKVGELDMIIEFYSR